MRCFYVLVHGVLHWSSDLVDAPAERPAGFYCHRYVLAGDEEQAIRLAFERVRTNLTAEALWIKVEESDLMLEAEEVRIAPFHKLLTPDNRGHTFYEME